MPGDVYFEYERQLIHSATPSTSIALFSFFSTSTLFALHIPLAHSYLMLGGGRLTADRRDRGLLCLHAFF